MTVSFHFRKTIYCKSFYFDPCQLQVKNRTLRKKRPRPGHAAPRPKSLMGYAETKGRVCACGRSDDSLHQISPTERRRWLKQRQSGNHCGEARRLGGQIIDHEVGGYSVAADFRGKLFIGEASEDPRSHKSSEGAEPVGSRDIVFDAIANTENIARVLNLGRLHSR